MAEFVTAEMKTKNLR